MLAAPQPPPGAAAGSALRAPARQVRGLRAEGPGRTPFPAAGTLLFPLGAPALTPGAAPARGLLNQAGPALYWAPPDPPSGVCVWGGARQLDCLARPQCAGEAAGTPFSPSLSFPGRFLRIFARPSAAGAGHRVPPGLRLRLPSSSTPLSPPTTACGARGTMIATKEKNKTPKDSMTLLPCFYFVEVRGAGPLFHMPSGTSTAEGQGWAQLGSAAGRGRARVGGVSRSSRGTEGCSGLRRQPGQVLGSGTFRLGYRPVARLEGLEQGAAATRGLGCRVFLQHVGYETSGSKFRPLPCSWRRPGTSHKPLVEQAWHAVRAS